MNSLVSFSNLNIYEYHFMYVIRVCTSQESEDFPVDYGFYRRIFNIIKACGAWFSEKLLENVIFKEDLRTFQALAKLDNVCVELCGNYEDKSFRAVDFELNYLQENDSYKIKHQALVVNYEAFNYLCDLQREFNSFSISHHSLDYFIFISYNVFHKRCKIISKRPTSSCALIGVENFFTILADSQIKNVNLNECACLACKYCLQD